MMSCSEDKNENHDVLEWQTIKIGKTVDVEEKINMFLKGTVAITCDEDRNTVLHHAVRTDDAELIEYLIATGCDVNLTNNKGDPPLACAIRKNCFKATKILLRAGAIHVNSYFKDLKGPLHIAVDYGLFDIVQLLIAIGVDVNARDKDLRTPLHTVKSSFHFFTKMDDYRDVIKILISSGADVNAEDCDGETPVTLAVSSFFDDKLDVMLSMATSINSKSFFDNLSLFDIILGCELSHIKQLFKLGVDMSVVDNDGNNLLHEAFRQSEIEVAEYLLDNGFVIDKVNNRGYDPLCEGISMALEYLEYYPSENDNHDKRNEVCNTRLKEQFQLIDLAVKRGANVNHVTNDKLTPLYIVLECCYYHSNCVRILLKYGATFDFEHRIVQKVMNDLNGSKFPLLLLRHTAMFEAQNRTDGPANFDLMKLNKKSQKDYYACCRDELESMKATKIYDTNISFFNVLVKKDISPYTRNESIVGIFESQYVSKSFPIYSDLLIDRFSKEVVNQKLVTKAAKGLGYVLRWNEGSMKIVLDSILSYLDEKDLNNLADV